MNMMNFAIGKLYFGKQTKELSNICYGAYGADVYTVKGNYKKLQEVTRKILADKKILQESYDLV